MATLTSKTQTSNTRAGQDAREKERTRKRQRLHERCRRRKRAYAVLGNWNEAAKRADYLSRCPQGCIYCANPRKTQKGRRKARLTRAELLVLDSFKEQLIENLCTMGEARPLRSNLQLADDRLPDQDESV